MSKRKHSPSRPKDFGRVRSVALLILRAEYPYKVKVARLNSLIARKSRLRRRRDQNADEFAHSIAVGYIVSESNLRLVRGPL